jgi:hypothetical protein
MKFLYFFWVIFALLDPDPDPWAQWNPDADPQQWLSHKAVSQFVF